ncbi:MAG: fasciclin domain-containing protein [Alphaproteobacteria bacterium]|nr:fasciclin domain-containing protein [Alphaproteobacteria bacterium]|tara:strand:- start:3635 stop:4249 length:615 start_codon:yes stop_codon:yes gene_type:complete
MKPFLMTATAAAALALVACSPSAPDADPSPVRPYEDDIVIDESAVETPADDMAGEMTDDIAANSLTDIIAQNADLSTFASALDAAGVSEKLAEGGPYTVFAPTNEAFANMPPEQLEMLLAPENKDKLVRVIEYHVVPGKIMAADIPPEAENGMTSSLNNLDMAARTTEDGKVMVNTSTVTSADIEASNGVVHIVDTVIVPRMSE